MEAYEEEAVTDLEILPDGRIFVFGASKQVLEILNAIQGSSDPKILARTSMMAASSKASQSTASTMVHSNHSQT
jgi:hypothetical protein